MSKDECMELKNLKYQTMLLNGNSKVISNNVSTASLIESTCDTINANWN